MKALLIVCTLCALVNIVLSAPASAQITSLPGLTMNINFKQYSGYITVDAPSGRNLFYWFVESQHDPTNDPLLLWLQGGPGCSSLLGFFTEHGPFQVTPSLQLALNPFSWNKNASIIYVEAPAGVGFSFLNDPTSPTGDNQTMADNYIFMQKWFALFPEFQGNKFFISGESYGGHYVPQLAWTIFNGNQAGTSKINLQGMLVGNPWTDSFIDTWSVPPFIFYHHLCSLPVFEMVMQFCVDNTTSDSIFSTFPPPLPSLRHIESDFFVDYKPRRLRGATDKCDAALDIMNDQVNDLTNQYDIYAPCVDPDGDLGCMNYTAVIDYLNTPEVWDAIHAVKPAPWAPCADIPFVEQWDSVLPIYPVLMKNMHVTVYAGDVTFNVPALGTEVWVEDFGLPVHEDYQAWLLHGQIAGYVKKFHGITYVTVKDSGHMVPTFTPEAGKAVLDNYIAGIF